MSKSSILNLEPVRTTRYPLRLRIGLPDVMPAVMLLVMVGITIALNPKLLTFSFLETKLDAGLGLVLLAVGQTFVILAGDFDLSAAGMVSLANSIAITQMTNDIGSIALWSAVAIMLGIVGGLLNGYLVSILGVNSFIATLATWSLWKGVAFLVQEYAGGTVTPMFRDIVQTQVFGLPGSLVAIIAIFVVWSYFRLTPWGTRLYAIGSNRAAAQQSGTPVHRAKILAYVLSGVFSALSGLYRSAEVGSGSPLAGDALLLPAIAGVLIGGTSLWGGSGGIGFSILGAMIMLVINDLIFFLQISTFYTPMVQGVLLIVGVAVGLFSRRYRLKAKTASDGASTEVRTVQRRDSS